MCVNACMLDAAIRDEPLQALWEYKHTRTHTEGVLRSLRIRPSFRSCVEESTRVVENIAPSSVLAFTRGSFISPSIGRTRQGSARLAKSPSFQPRPPIPPDLGLIHISNGQKCANGLGASHGQDTTTQCTQCGLLSGAHKGDEKDMTEKCRPVPPKKQAGIEALPTF